MTNKTPHPRCLQCGRPIAKKMTTLWFRVRDPNGHDRDAIKVDKLPANRAEAQLYTNGVVISVRLAYGGGVRSAGVWSGEYTDPHFCTEGCAARFGRAAARKLTMGRQ